MAYEQLGVAGLTNEQRITYERGMLMRAVPAFVHAIPENARVAMIPERGGNSIQFRRLELVSATTTALTEGTPGAATQITVSAASVTVVMYGQYAQITDVAETQSIDPIVMESVEMFGESMGNSLDQVVRNVITAGTTVNYASTGGSRGGESSGMYLNYAEIRKAIATLERSDAKPFADGFFRSIIHPDTKRDLMSDTNVLNTWQYASERGATNPLLTGAFEVFYKTKWLTSTNARIFSSAGLSGADVYGTVFFGREAYGITSFDAFPPRVYVVPRGTPSKSDPLSQFGTVGWKASMAAVRLNENFLVRVEHVTSQKNAA